MVEVDKAAGGRRYKQSQLPNCYCMACAMSSMSSRQRLATSDRCCCERHRKSGVQDDRIVRGGKTATKTITFSSWARICQQVAGKNGSGTAGVFGVECIVCVDQHTYEVLSLVQVAIRRHISKNSYYLGYYVEIDYDCGSGCLC